MATGPSNSIGARVQKDLAAGKAAEDVVRDLVAGGLSPQTAERFVERALADGSPPPARTPATPSERSGRTDDTGERNPVVSGAFWFSAGITATVTTYLLAAPGQRFTVAYGAVVAGLIALGRGIKRWSELSQPFPWLAVLAAMAAPPIGTTAVVGVSSLLQHRRHEARRHTEEARLEAARAAQEEARAVKERAAAGEARTQRHTERVARARERLQTSTHPMTLCDAALDLGHAQAREAIPDLIAFLSRTSEAVRIRNCAAGALIEMGEGARALPIYADWAGSGILESRTIAFMGFRAMGPPAAEVAIPYLREAGQSPNSDQRFLAVDTLAKLGPAAEPLLREATRDTESRVRERAARALASMAP